MKSDILILIGKRLGLGVVTLFVVSLVIFAAVESLPGSFAEEILGQGATPEAVEAIKKDLGLHLPPHERYLSWLGRAIQGDFGRTFDTNEANRRQVSELLGGRFANTLYLALLAAILAVPFSLLLGILAALYRNSIYDRVVNVVTLSWISSPEFFVAYILMLYFAQILFWFPSASLPSDAMNYLPVLFGELEEGQKSWTTRLHATFLPALTLTLVVTAHMMRMTRAAIINLLASPYIEMARLKGLSPGRIIVVHALPNALAPIINVIALNLAYLITGVVVVEVVFTYPGVGDLFVASVKQRNIPVVQATCLIFAAAYILLNLTADVLTILSNPRLRHPK